MEPLVLLVLGTVQPSRVPSAVSPKVPPPPPPPGPEPLGCAALLVSLRDPSISSRNTSGSHKELLPSLGVGKKKKKLGNVLLINHTTDAL